MPSSAAPIKLFVDGLDAINKAQQDGDGWALPDGIPANLRERLAKKGMAMAAHMKWWPVIRNGS